MLLKHQPRVPRVFDLFGAPSRLPILVHTLPSFRHTLRPALLALSLDSSLQAPQCGFTDATVHLFDQLQVDYECIDCLDEERNPGLREVSG